MMLEIGIRLPFSSSRGLARLKDVRARWTWHAAPHEVVTFCNLVVLTLLLDGRSNWSGDREDGWGEWVGEENA